MTSTLETTARPHQPLPLPERLTFEEFLAWDSGETSAEWVDGEVVPLSPNSADHQQIALFLLRLISAYVEARRLGQVFMAPFLMRLPTRPSGREPDILFVASEHTDRVRHTYLDGPADLAIEIVSPESDVRDRGDKFLEYEAGGISEYWLIDPLRREASFYRRGADGRYHPGPIDADGFYHSTSLPGFRLRVEWLWQRPLPAVSALLDQVGV